MNLRLPPRFGSPLPLGVVAAVALALHLLPAATVPDVQAADEEAAGVQLDFEFYRQRVAPVVHSVCAPCHANPRKRLGKHFLRPSVGRRVKDRDHKRNFETIAKFIEPGNPAASVWLLKPLGPRQGGVTHEGGQRINMNSVEYGFMVDFINGATVPPPSFRPPETETGQPDFLFYVSHIAPPLAAICAECHKGKGHGRMKLIAHPRRDDFPLEDHFKNYQTVLKLIKVGKPDKSRFLQKPLSTKDGGLRHKGRDVIKRGDELYTAWVKFITGEPGPPLPTKNTDLAHTLTATGFTLEAEACAIDGDADVEEDKTASGFFTVRAGKERAHLRADLRVDDAGSYRMMLRIRPSNATWGWGLEPDGPASTFAAPEDATTDEAGFLAIGPNHLTEGGEPFVDARGPLSFETITEENKPDRVAITLDGRRSVAGWLSPVDVEHNGAALHVTLAEEESRADDALLLYRAPNLDNGIFLGLTDGGRRLVIGILRDGKRQVVDSAKADVPTPKGAATILSLQSYEGLLVGSINARPRVSMHLKRPVRGGHVGVLTRGVATVHRIAALEEFEVYTSSWTLTPTVYLPRGDHDLRITIPPGGVIDSISFAPALD